MTSKIKTSITISTKGQVKEIKLKIGDTDEIYKKCNTKTGNIEVLGEYINNKHFSSKLIKRIVLYGKNEGRAGTENKYEFPPPFDKNLYFGTIVIIAYNSLKNVDFENIIELKKDLWKKLYDDLFGGFEDIDDDEDDEEDDDEDDTESDLDDFIVNDNFKGKDEEDEEDDYDDEECQFNDYEDDIEYENKKIKKNNEEEENCDDWSDTSSYLSEESYLSESGTDIENDSDNDSES